MDIKLSFLSWKMSLYQIYCECVIYKVEHLDPPELNSVAKPGFQIAAVKK